MFVGDVGTKFRLNLEVSRENDKNVIMNFVLTCHSVREKHLDVDEARSYFN